MTPIFLPVLTQDPIGEHESDRIPWCRFPCDHSVISANNHCNYHLNIVIYFTYVIAQVVNDLIAEFY